MLIQNLAAEHGILCYCSKCQYTAKKGFFQIPHRALYTTFVCFDYVSIDLMFIFQFAPCFLQFLKESQPEPANRVERLLRRTFITGTRGFPPSWLEFQVKPISFPNNTKLLVINT